MSLTSTTTASTRIPLTTTKPSSPSSSAKPGNSRIHTFGPVNSIAEAHNPSHTTAKINTITMSSKRKPADNPLMAAAKKAKKEAKLKRKLVTDEEDNNPATIANHISLLPQPSQHANTGASSSSSVQPPNKKFKPEASRSKPSKTANADRSNTSGPTGNAERDDAEVELDVRAMEDEADKLRRDRRKSTVDRTLLASETGDTGSEKRAPGGNGSGAVNPAFDFGRPPSSQSQHPVPSKSRTATASSSSTNPGQPKSKSKTKSGLSFTQNSQSHYHHMDTSQPIPESETPQIERNKRLRQGAMDAIISDREEEENRGPFDFGSQNGTQTPSRGRGVERGAETPGSGRRKSSVGRGKRVSMSFASTGVIAHPHNSVSESSFYKHIDADIPEPERLRQLLIWCSVRAANATASGSASSSKPPSASTVPEPPLPPLSANASKALKSIQDNLVKMLADKRVDLSEGQIGRSRGGTEDEALAENEQNVRNRKWEVVYSEHILGARREEEAWKKLSYAYETYSKKLQASLERRAADLNIASASSSSADPSLSQSLSAKARGKRRATGDVTMADGVGEDGDLPDGPFKWPGDNQITSEFQPALSLCRNVLLGRGSGSASRRGLGDARIAGGGTPARSNVLSPSMAVETELSRRITEAQYKIDMLYTLTSAAKSSAMIVERALDQRFDILREWWERRVMPFADEVGEVGGVSSEGEARGVRVMREYVGSGSLPLAGSTAFADSLAGNTGGNKGEDDDMVSLPPPPKSSIVHPLAFLRTLARVDATRPPSQISDAVRRAAREVQRAVETGQGVVGERRVVATSSMANLGVPNSQQGLSMPMTPRKMPGTPRRDRTPGRERTPARERTPGR